MSEEENKKAKVQFTDEQMAVINDMIKERLNSSKSARPSGHSEGLSVYDARDPKKIESVNVRRFDGKFVIGFVDHSNGQSKKPKYILTKSDGSPDNKRGGLPYITLILADGETDSKGKLKTEEKEILLTEYMDERKNSYTAKLIDIIEKEEVIDTGFLGRNGTFAGEVDSENKPVTRSKIKAQYKMLTRVFIVELPGFVDPVELKEDFVA